jgi:hypothetical protein
MTDGILVNNVKYNVITCNNFKNSNKLKHVLREKEKKKLIS